MQLTQTINKDVIGRVMVPSILINLLSLAVPLTVLQIYDRILPNQSYGTATLLIVGACTAVLLESFIRYVRSWLLSAAASNTEKETFDQLVSAVTNAKPNELRMLGASSVDNGLSSISRVKEWYSGGMVSGFIDFPFALLFLGLVYYIGSSLVLVPIAVWVLASAVVWLASIKSKRLGEDALEKEQDRKGFMLLLGQTLQGIKRQAVESRLYRQFKRTNDERFLSKSSEEQQNAFALEFIQLASLMTSVVIVITGSIWVLDGDLTTGGLAACSILSGRAIAPLSALIGMRVKLNSIHSANQAIGRIRNLPQHSFEVGDIKSVNAIAVCNLTAQRYSHTYSVSFEMARGEIIHLSSDERHIDSFFAGVIPGVDGAQSGDFLINHDSASIESLSSISSYAGVKGQLVSGSLLDNLCGFDPERTERAQQYAQKLGVSSKLAQLSDGLETKVGHAFSSPLSMGDIKLLNLAAQLAATSPLVVLDRPDASLDLDGLEALNRVLREEKTQGRMIVLVSHHPAIIELTDRTMIVEEKQGAAA
ncbi:MULTISPECIES: ABC transporter transmembrane domain-containing protein [Vibrio]|uniref:ABC transporter transmembrane domain-containing protein n=1 Tax=Vibrio TaxID=662 RepID=UPI00207574C5|nr:MULTISPECIES: ABC transporter transmembrane domain-containing protein [Vibrio]USD34171.1 ABC transporter [Vibrio sp. SCSIO 43186]USD47242.1 ABC transporter [Vibrio sp. SCSIO 43145]USD71295.1 ABC transporter [Vibrio sp. SCSIO 43139]USD98208.1 ABC transporter [Vibrio coralliilyticus]